MDTKDKSAWKRALLPILPGTLVKALSAMPDSAACALEEIRVRAARPAMVIAPTGKYLSPSGKLSDDPSGALCVSLADCAAMLERLSQHSLYTLGNEMRQGYISLPGGYRVGFCGKPVLEDGGIRHFTNLTSFCLRIAREHKGCADKVMPYLFQKSAQGNAQSNTQCDTQGSDKSGVLMSTLILSPPRCGKTTIIRDIARQLSSGYNGKARQVVIVDERSEIAGSYRGVPQNDVGPSTDVLDACPKAEGMRLALRAMSPDVLVTDEIASEADRQCIIDASGAGVAVLASAHAASLEDAMKRPVLNALLKDALFPRIILLSRELGAGTVAGIYDETQTPTA